MFTKSRSLLSLSLVVVFSLILSACGTPSTPSQNGEPSEPTGEVVPPVDVDKSITIIIPEDPPSFNPFVADTGYDSLVMELVMLGLADLDPNGNPFPELAAELPGIENGGVILDEEAGTMSVTWTMRDDVQWSDGTPVTADDVIFTWDAISNPDTGSWIPGSDYIDSVEKVDQFSFVVNYNTLYPGYLTQFGGEQVAIWPAHYCNAEQGFLAWDCGREPLSNGHFVLHDWIEGDHMTFHRNDNFYLEGKPEIQQVIVQIVPDDAVRKTMMMNGDADIDMWINVNTAKDLEGLEDVVKVSLSPTDRWVMRLYFNLAERGTVDASATPHPILSDVNVRKAIRAAVDVDTITQEIFFGLATPTWTEFFRPPYQCEISRPAYDPEAAKAILEQAGWTDSDGDGVRECNGCATAEPGHVMEMDFITYAEFGEPLEITQQLIAEMIG